MVQLRAHAVMVLFAAALSVSLSACGGSGSVSPAPAPTPTGTPSGGGTTGGSGGTGGSTTSGSPAKATVITVAAGSTNSGVNFVLSGQKSGTLNIEVLGATSTSSSGGSAFNTGAAVARGQSSRILIFGDGLSADETVTIGGPGDITVSSIQQITATTGLAGLMFVINVPANAATGARSVFVRRSNGDMAAFAGGLEVLP